MLTVEDLIFLQIINSSYEMNLEVQEIFLWSRLLGLK
jgi:hypothetical protein